MTKDGISFPQPRHGQKLFRRDANGGAGRAGTDTGRAAGDAGAHAAFDRLLRSLRRDPRLGPFLGRFARPGAQSRQHPSDQLPLLRRPLVDADAALGTVALAISAVVARIVDPHLAVRPSMAGACNAGTTTK